MPSMPNTAELYACGSNLQQQIREQDERGGPLAIHHFVPVPADDVRVDRILAVSASQVAYTISEGSQAAIKLAGFQHDRWVTGERQNEALEARSWLGKDYFRALLSSKGQIVSLEQEIRSSTIFNAAAMDSHRHVLAISSDHHLRLYEKLDDVFLDTYNGIALPEGSDLSDVAIYAGAAHFMILLNQTNGSEKHTTVFGLGDNRFFQQGHDQPSSWTEAREVDFFDESASAVVKIACGDLHTAFLTADGALYMSGSDAKGQCGGFSQQEPSLVEWEVHGHDDEEVDVLDVACGATHTIALTSKDYAGQLGIENTTDKQTFGKVTLPAGGAVSAVYAAGWNTFIKLQNSA